MLEAGKNGQRHDDASKEVTVPVGVAVVSITQGFLLTLPSAPTPITLKRPPPYAGSISVLLVLVQARITSWVSWK